MRRTCIWVPIAMLTLLLTGLASDSPAAKEVVRPEEIRSMRQVVYDSETYAKLAGLWKEYFDEYPSEYAYANWMYAARYAGDKNYSELLDKGLKQYPANPTLLYLKGIESPGAEEAEGRKYLEKAAAMDPAYLDPWFALVTHYMNLRDQESLDRALRRLLESGVITDEVMDYNYNVLVSLEEDAILITNGDNDTFPAWILTRILKLRPDVTIVNRSLLNADWYPIYVIEQGVPRFISQSELAQVRTSIIREAKEKKTGVSRGGLFGDTLVLKIVESATRAERPVYLARTLFPTDKLTPLFERGRNLGLVTLVTPTKAPYAEQLRRVYETWLESFRTDGLRSWRLRNAPQRDAGRMLGWNYGAGLVTSLESLKQNAPELRLELFHWYVEYVEELLPVETRHEFAQAWGCGAADVKEIDSWRRQQGLECKK
jgi:hypothetical protein